MQEYPTILMQHQEETAILGQQINKIIANSSGSETVLQQIAQALGEGFQVDCCLITVKSDNSDLEQTAHWYCDNHPAVSSQPQMLALKQRLASLMPTDSDVLVIEDIQSISNILVTGWRHLPLPVGAVLGIPTRFQGKICGVIILSRSHSYDWTHSEKERALAVAAPVALAIAQVVQTKLIASLQQEVHTKAQYQTLINRLMMASRSSLELNQLLNLAIAGTAQTLQVDRGLLLMLKYGDPLFKSRESRKHLPKAKATVICEWPNGQDSSLLNQSFWISECCLCQQAFTESPRAVVFAAVDNLLANDKMDIAPLFNLSYPGGLLLLPLESQGTVLGFLVLQHSEPRLFSSEELALLELVSSQVSSAIIQSQTLRQVQALVEERTAQLQSSLKVQANLYEKTRRQIDQLRQLNQLQDEFLSTVNHELRTPLTSMSLAIRMLRQPGLPTERQTKYLDILEQQCSQEINLINDLLTLQELQSHPTPLELETVDLKSKIQDLAQAFEKKWADKGLTITVDLPKASLLIHTEADSLKRILQELLTNAGKYCTPDTTVVFRATRQINQQLNQIVLTLTNFSHGLSPEDATYIFDKFRRGQGVTQQAVQGTGLGLALVKCLVQHLNGTINVSICPSSDLSMSEICFTLTLPQFFEPHSTRV